MSSIAYWYPGNSMLIELDETTDLSDDTKVTSGASVQAEVYDEDGTLRATVAMSHVADGLWQGIASVDDVDPHISVGDRIKVVYLLDGGGPTSQAKWTDHPKVTERRT